MTLCVLAADSKYETPRLSRSFIGKKSGSALLERPEERCVKA